MKLHKLVVSVVLGATALAACGSSHTGATSSTTAGSGSSGKSTSTTAAHTSYAGQTLTVMIGAPTSNIANTNTFNNDVAAAFHKATGATLKYQTYTSASAELTAIETSVVSHSGPDVMNLGSTLIPSAYATHAFDTLSASDWATVGGRSSFFTQQLKMAGPSTSSYIAVPIDAVPFAMAYNTTLFKKAGISGPPKTWTQYVQDAQKINNPSQGVYGTGIDPADPYDSWKDYWTIVHQLGGHFVSPNGKTANLSSAQMVDAVKFWFDWYSKYHIVNPNALTWKGADLLDAFAAGKIGEIPIQSISDVAVYKAGAIGNHFAFATPPSVPYGLTSRPAGGTPASTIVSGQYDVIASYAPKALALQFLKVATSAAMQQLQWKYTNELPVKPAVANAVAATDPSLIKPFVTALQNADPTAFVGAWGTVEAAIASASQSIAAHLAAHGQPTSSYIKSVLAPVNSDVQQQL